MERLLLGDNQFFGINHMSEERARERAMRFQELGAIMEVLDASLDEGVGTFMCTTHERVAEICDEVRRDPGRRSGLEFFPCMPYAHKYANAMTEGGPLAAVRTFLPDSGLLDAAVRGGTSLAGRNIDGLVTLLIDAEMKMFHGLRTPVVFLQNVVVDLLLGLGFDEAFSVFAQHVRQRYDAEPGFITMNMPALLDVLERQGIDNPIVCFNLNKLGFRMSGGLEAYHQAMATRRFRPVAMSVFASGALPPRDALEWVCAQPGLEAIVFGASSRRTIRSTVDLVDELWVPAAPAVGAVAG